MNLPIRSMTGAAARLIIGVNGPNTVRIEGVLRDPDVPTWLTDAINQIHGAAVSRRIDEITLDIQPLEFANAAAWRCLMGWLHLLRTDPEARYRLRIVSVSSCHWQQIGIRTMRILGKEQLVCD
jgi:hypothetical protein